MIVKKTYYLKKKGQELLMTYKEINSTAVVDVIDCDSVYFHFKDQTIATSACMKYEFNKIFSSKPNFI